MPERIVTHVVSTTVMIITLTISCMRDWSIENNHLLAKQLTVLMLILDQIVERRLISLQNWNQMAWMVRCLVFHSSMSIDDQLLMLYHWCWLYELAFWYVTYQNQLPQYFQIRYQDFVPITGLVPWFIAYQLLQFEPLTAFLRIHRTTYMIAAQSTCVILNYIEHPMPWKISYFIPTIVAIFVFHHRSDQQLLSLLVFLATCNLFKTYEHLRIQHILNDEFEIINFDNIGQDAIVPVGGDNGN